MLRDYIPQFLVLTLMIMALAAESMLHGSERSGKHNFWIGLIDRLLFFTLLLLGGFWEGFL